MQNFQDVLDQCGLTDLGYSNPDYTWHGHRRGEMIWERLDRCVANYEWLAKFPTGGVKHLNCFTSDHRPILLALNVDGEHQKWRRKPFRFEEMWILDPGCRETITKAWDCALDGTPMFVASQKLKKCMKGLKDWSHDHFGNVQKSIKQLKDRLWRAEEVSARSGNYEVTQMKKELNILVDKEEQMWQQRSCIQWLKSGDQNTRFFHGSATKRKRRNFIKGLRDDQGVWEEDEEVFSALLTEFYSNLFTSSNPHDLDCILEGVQTVVTVEMRVKLDKPYTSEEVGEAIREMAPLKAPGLDGMPPLFFQTYWTNVGMDVTQAVLSCLNSGSILKFINHTFITLIPKVNNPDRVSDFRPISFCNVIYKIIGKVIANRLKPLLDSIILETHNAFIADRLIIDNILLAFESLHHMKTNCTRKKAFMAIKLYMNKAYNRVKWVFLERILLKLGF